ncbi:MAG TPA: tetratricopeptide repeat protein [Lysobacter sp.]
MNLRTLAAIALMVLMPAANACINSVGTDVTGRRFQPGWEVGKDMAKGLMERSQGPSPYWVKLTLEDARKEPDFKSLTNIGVLLIYQGQYTIAVQHFLKVERIFPGHHETAANLGTALELSGHDAVALRWIRLGVERDPDEHYRSEWLHERILEAKIALAKDPDYLKDRSVVGIAFEPKLAPPLPTSMPAGNDGKPVEPWVLNWSLHYQLHERTRFVKPRDPIVANLMRDWATLNLAGGPIEDADALYDLAVLYGAERDALMKDRQRHIRQILSKGGEKEPDDYRCKICQPAP